jgi:MFS transporter, FSR family, fosmidomycin resistance protein
MLGRGEVQSSSRCGSEGRTVPEEAVHHHLIDTRSATIRLALALTIFTVVASISLSLMPIVASEMQDRFGFSASQIGLLTSVYMLTFGLGALPMGLLGARWGGWTLLLGAIVLTAGSVLFALSSSYPWFLIGRLLQGLGTSAYVPVSNALITRNVDRRHQDWALGVFGCGTGLGVVAALLIMPSIQAAGGYRAVFLTTAGIAVVFALVALVHRVVRSRPRDEGMDVSFVTLLRAVGAIALNRRLLLLVVINIGALAVFVGVLTWTPLFLHDQHGTSLAVAAYLTAGLGVAQILGNIGGAAAMARWGKPFVLSAGMIVMLIAIALIPFTPWVVAVFACVVVAGFLTMALFPAMLGSIAEVVPRLEQVGPANGFMNLTNLVATLFAPWLFGVLLDAYGTGEGEGGYLWGYLLLALFALLGAIAGVVYVVSRRRAGRHAPEQA